MSQIDKAKIDKAKILEAIRKREQRWRENLTRDIKLYPESASLDLAAANELYAIAYQIEAGDFDCKAEPDKDSEAYKIIYADGFVAGQNQALSIDEIHAHILRNWKREDIERIAYHLLGDICQKCKAEPISRHQENGPVLFNCPPLCPKCMTLHRSDEPCKVHPVIGEPVKECGTCKYGFSHPIFTDYHGCAHPLVCLNNDCWQPISAVKKEREGASK